MALCSTTRIILLVRMIWSSEFDGTITVGRAVDLTQIQDCALPVMPGWHLTD